MATHQVGVNNLARASSNNSALLRESDRGQVAEKSVAARLADVRIPLHQMGVGSYVVESAIFIENRLVANRAITILGGFDTNTGIRQTRAVRGHRGFHSGIISQGRYRVYSFFSNF